MKDFGSGTQIQMISVAQNNLSLHVFLQFMLMNRFYGAECTHRHKYRSLNLPVVSGYHPGTSVRELIGRL